MATDLGGRWITTDSGQHVFIKTGGGSVRAQVKAHFAAQGQPGHPDIAKKVTEHPAGHDPRSGGVKSLREMAAEHRAGKGTREQRVAAVARKVKDQETFAGGKRSGPISNTDSFPARHGLTQEHYANLKAQRESKITAQVKARQAEKERTDPQYAKRAEANRRLDRQAARDKVDHEAGKAKLNTTPEAERARDRAALTDRLRGQRETLQARGRRDYSTFAKGTKVQTVHEKLVEAKNAAKAIHSRAEATTPVRLSTTTVTVVKSPRARSLTAQLVIDDMKRQREGMSSNPAAGKAAPTSTLREQIAKAKAEGRLAPGRGTEERETLAAARLKARAKYPVKGGAATPSPAAHPTGAAFADRVKASAAKVGPEGRFGSSKVYVADAHKAYEADHGKIPIADFKSRLAEANQGRHIDLSRADLVEAMPQSKLVASQIKHQGAEFHFIRTTPLASESKGFSPGAEAPKAGASIDLSGHRAKLSEALTGSPSRQLDKLHELRGEVFQSSLKGGGATKETMSLRSEIQGHMDRIERGMSKPSGSVLDKETADEIARNKRVPLKGQGDFTSKASGELSETHGRVLGALKGGPKDFRTLRDELGHKTLDPQNPLKNPVHAAAKELRDKGLIEATESRFGSATVKLTAKGEDALKIAKPTAIRERIASTAAQQTGGIKAGQAGFREKLSARGVADSEATTSPTWKSGSSKIRSRLQTKGEVARESETIGRENTATFRKNLQGVSRSDLPDEEKVARFRRLKNAVTGSTERADNMRAEIDTKIHAFSSTGKTPAAPTSTFTQRTSGVAVGQSGFKQKLSAMLAARKPAPAPGGFGLRSAPNGGTRKLF